MIDILIALDDAIGNIIGIGIDTPFPPETFIARTAGTKSLGVTGGRG
jgi:hypothetical protein